MATPNKRPAPSNRVAPDGEAGARRARSLDKGDVPPALLDRYLVERDRQGRAERFYRDHRAREPMFQDRAFWAWTHGISNTTPASRSGPWFTTKPWSTECSVSAWASSSNS
ncbi:hypothetical protein A4249_03180 [Brevundimonas sp. GW460-12-10-14-LB2]|jgi:hypothetical protein|uniref:hypothetical protein n=1 Tax=Brevundimonas sp. GW460-12-10-14-LB2 TaxID=1827469 RepID=UPI0007BCBB42|nr:hypothetical protein [Brevundimonas sp. GW460-12-10-14-LB2]ANC52758.1 hypothetical protein A4249_03180 [Brevundimonas sp. GW460-12-10-14-LB2]